MVSAAQDSFVGGVRLPFVLWNWGWPAARLTVTDDKVVVEPSAAVFRAFFVPTRKYTPDGLERIDLVGHRRSFQGVRLMGNGGTGDWTIFWSFHCREVIDSLIAHGYDVARDPTPVRYFARYPGS